MLPKATKKRIKKEVATRKKEAREKAVKEEEQLDLNQWWSLRHVLSYDYMIFYILLGARERGKSYAIMNYFVSQYKKNGIPFYWIRLTDTQQKELLINNAMKLVDQDIRRKYKLDLVTVGDNVYETEHETVTVTSKDGVAHEERREIRSKRRLFARVMCASTFYNDKGSLFDNDFLNDPKMKYHICIDEFEREKGEKKTFDIAYAIVNQLENISRSTKDRIKVFFVGNTLEEASDILCLFNFIPEKNGIFQLVKNKKKLIEYIKEIRACNNDADKKLLVDYKYRNYDFGKRCLVENIQNSKAYNVRRHGTIADILMPKSSTFTNKIDTDNALISKETLKKPISVIKFTKNPKDWFTVWNSNLIAPYKNEQKQVIAMRPYLDEIYNQEMANNIITIFDIRGFVFKNLITFKQFQNQLMLFKPRKG